jgi:hypothetical protein
MQHHRKVFHELLAEFRQLQLGQITDPGSEDQLPHVINGLPHENQWSHDSGVISMDGIAVARFQGAYNGSDSPSATIVHADAVSETAD